MPKSDQLSREIEKISKEVTTVQELTELVMWDGVIRATFTTFKIVDGVRYQVGEPAVTSRSAELNPETGDWLDQAYTMVSGWLAEDAKPVKSVDAADAALDAQPVVP